LRGAVYTGTGWKGSKMTSRERVLKALRHEEPDRVPIHDSPWAASISRWHKEGLPESISAGEYFGYEFRSFGADCTPRFPVKTLEVNEDFIVETTPYGGVRRNFRAHDTTPEVIDYPVKTKDDWERIKERLQPDFTRVDWASGLQGLRRAKEEGYFTHFSAAFGYDQCQSYIASEQLLALMLTDPEWISDILHTQATLVIEMMKMMMENGFDFDGAFLYDDNGYRNGTLFSPSAYRDIVFPVHKMVYDFCHEHGLPTILHSCGNVKEFIPMYIEAGLDCLQPLEVKAGMDLVELKREYGDDLAFMGGIDVRAMADPDPSVIEEEVRTKFEAAMSGGGYIYHSDHSVPKNVSFKQYCHTMELVKEYGRY